MLPVHGCWVQNVARLILERFGEDIAQLGLHGLREPTLVEVKALKVCMVALVRYLADPSRLPTQLDRG